MKKKVALTIFLGAALSANASIISTATGGDSYRFTDEWNYAAQTFSVANDIYLQDFEFQLSNLPDNRTEISTISIHEWSNNSPAGPALYNFTFSWTPAGGIIGFNNANIALTGGRNYAALIDLAAARYYPDTMDSYEGVLYTSNQEEGNLFLSQNKYTSYLNFDTFDLSFTARFSELPENNNIIPEPGSLPLIALAASYIFFVRRIKKEQWRSHK